MGGILVFYKEGGFIQFLTKPVYVKRKVFFKTFLAGRMFRAEGTAQ